MEDAPWPFAPSETLDGVEQPCRYRHPTGPAIQTPNPPPWLFPMSETSAPAGRGDTLCICTWFHAPGATHFSFCKMGGGGGVRETNGIMYASGNSCDCCPLVSSAHIQTAAHRPQRLATKTQIKRTTTDKDQVTLIKALAGVTTVNGWIKFFMISFWGSAGGFVIACFSPLSSIVSVPSCVCQKNILQHFVQVDKIYIMFLY